MNKPGWNWDNPGTEDASWEQEDPDQWGEWETLEPAPRTPPPIGAPDAPLVECPFGPRVPGGAPEDQLPPETGGGRWNRRGWRNKEGRRWGNRGGRMRHRAEHHFGEQLIGPEFEHQLDEQINDPEHQPGGWRNRSGGRRFGERRGRGGRRWMNKPGWNWDNPGTEDASWEQEPHNTFGN